MKKILFNFMLCFPLVLIGQNTNIVAPSGAYPSEAEFHPVYLEKSECLSAEDRLELEHQIYLNKQQILSKNPDAFNRSGNITLLYNRCPKFATSDFM